MGNNSQNRKESNKNLFDISSEQGKNSFEKNLNDFSTNFPINNTINNNSSEKNLSLSGSDNDLCKQMEDNKTPYKNKDKIPLIKIKDKNTLESGAKIETYLKSVFDIDDGKYNKCKKCNYNNNIRFFCLNCSEHLCYGCSEKCKNEMHFRKDLNEKKRKVDRYRKKIKLFIRKYNFQITDKSEKKENEIQKAEINYNSFDSNEINDEIRSNISNYPNDISLIETIISKDYINYFHYQNIKECYLYIKKKYPELSKKKKNKNYKNTNAVYKKLKDYLTNEISKITIDNNTQELIILKNKTLDIQENKAQINIQQNKIEFMFNNKVERDKMLQIIKNIFINDIKASFNYEKLSKFINFLIVGTVGKGKSSFINQIFKEKNLLYERNK